MIEPCSNMALLPFFVIDYVHLQILIHELLTWRLDATAGNHQSSANKKKTRPKDVFGRALPTEEDFDVLKNAPR